MRMIIKGQEPRSLTQYRLQRDSTYIGYPEKNDLREALVSEQRGLCCYCTKRIKPHSQDMKIEHWKCQANYPDLQLDYSNMLGSCSGITDLDRHCDTSKGDQNLKWNPANLEHRIEDRIQYRSDGTVEGKTDDSGRQINEEFNYQVNNVLNLNVKRLMNNRKVVYEEVLKWWQSTPNARQRIQNEINKRTGEIAYYTPFSPVAVWFLRQKL